MSRDRARNSLDELLEQFVRAHLAGEAPDPVAFASRAGPEAPRLREAIALYLAESEPVEPSPEAAAGLAARYAGERSPQRDDAAAAADSLTSTLALLLTNWRASTVEWRTELLDWIGSSTFGLTLAPETMRGTEPATGCTRIPLRHPSGASVEIDEDDQLRLTIFGMPPELVGSCPLVAFPWIPADNPDLLAWADHDLPDGLVEAEAIDENRVLHAQVGRLVERGHLERLLREIRVVAIPAGRARG